MTRHLFARRLLFYMVILMAGALIVSCAPKLRTASSELDTPAHHVVTGMKLFEQGDMANAQREFLLALQLNPKFAKAHMGSALVKAQMGAYESALESMEKAEDYAKTKDEKLALQITFIRVYTAGQKGDWLDDAKDAYEEAIDLDASSAAANYFMGVAYKKALNFSAAGQMFRKVLDLNTDYIKEADNEWNLCQKIVRAMPGTATGKKIALVEKITRADAAALFMEELNIDVLYKKKTVKDFDTSFRDPEKAKADAGKEAMTASDINNHPLRADMEGIMAIGVRGLERFPDGQFHPYDQVTRAEYAVMIEDILTKVAPEYVSSTKFIGGSSPFPDVNPSVYYANAVVVVSSRGIMQALDLSTGEFVPMGPVAGVDALLIIRKIKEELKIF